MTNVITLPLEAAPDAIVIVNHSGRIVNVNRLTEKMFGYSRDELLGQAVEVLVPENSRRPHIHHRDQYFASPKTRPMGEGRALKGRKKDGSEFPLEISLSPLKDQGEDLVISIIRDVGPRIRLEAKFRGLLESAPDGIVVVDTQGCIVMVNSQTENMFGYSRNELIGQHVEILVPQRLQHGHIRLREQYTRNPKTRPMGAGRALSGLRKDGSEIPIEISLSPLETEQGTLITSIVRDITDRRRAEEQIQASLREKEALLKEIHHRVKNNLQVTSSLLRLQSGFIDNEKAKELFIESQHRIRSMALVHEKLYQSRELSRINFPEYIDSLSNLLFRSFGVDPAQVGLKIEGKDIFLTVESAVPCGLMINELVSNCLKHAFPDHRKGEIRICITNDKTPHQFKLEVLDNGIGLPLDFDLENSDTLGLQLVRTLTQQLSGKLELLRSEGGTGIRITFSDIKAGAS